MLMHTKLDKTGSCCRQVLEGRASWAEQLVVGGERMLGKVQINPEDCLQLLKQEALNLTRQEPDYVT